MFQEKLRREKEEKEWADKQRVATENFERAKRDVEAIAAAIDAWSRLERERIEKEKQGRGWWTYLTFLGTAQRVEETAEEKTARRQEELHQQASRSIKLHRAKDELRQREAEKAQVLLQWKQAKDRDIRERETKERAAKAKEATERTARQQDEARAREAMRKAAQERARKVQEAEAEAEKIAAQKRAEREREREEWRARERIRERLVKLSESAPAAGKAKAEAAKPSTRPPPPFNPNTYIPPQQRPRQRFEPTPPSHDQSKPSTRPSPREGHTTQQKPRQRARPAPSVAEPRFGIDPRANPELYHFFEDRERKAAATAASCAHSRYWPKVAGRQQCGVCAQTLGRFLLKCPGCGVLACVDCKKELCAG